MFTFLPITLRRRQERDVYILPSVKYKYKPLFLIKQKKYIYYWNSMLRPSYVLWIKELIHFISYNISWFLTSSLCGLIFTKYMLRLPQCVVAPLSSAKQPKWEENRAVCKASETIFCNMIHKNFEKRSVLWFRIF